MTKNINPTVIFETKYIAKAVGVLSILMQSVFLVLGRWDYKVLIANIYTDFFMVLNFYIMGMSVAKAVEKDEKEARSVMKTSLMLRNLMIFSAIAVGVLIPVFNIIALIVPFVFVRIAIFLRPLFKNGDMIRKGEKNE